MADSIKPTPRNRVLGVMADSIGAVDRFARKPFGYDNPPAAVLSDLIGLSDLQKFMDNRSYGDSLISGSGLTTTIRPDVLAAASMLPLGKPGKVAALANRSSRAERSINQVAKAAGRSDYRKKMLDHFHKNPWAQEEFLVAKRNHPIGTPDEQIFDNMYPGVLFGE